MLLPRTWLTLFYPSSKFNGTSFIHKLLNNKISYPEIINIKISYHILTFNARSTVTFYIPFRSQLYSFNEPFSRSFRECNSVAFDFNLDNEFKLRYLC